MSGQNRRSPWDPDIIAALDGVQLDPAARRWYFGFAGGFVWDDEWVRDRLPGELEDLLRHVVAHRAARIRGESSDLEGAWLFLQQHCPHWPGFHPDRSSPALCAELDAAEKAFFDSLEESGW